MNKILLVACAVAGGLFVALAFPPPTQALPSVNSGIEKKADAVTPVAGVFAGRGASTTATMRTWRAATTVAAAPG